MTEAILTKKKEVDLFTEDGLTKQTGTDISEWDIYLIKELMDNALDACESAGVEPKIKVTIRGNGVTIRDNGPGITRETVDKIVDLNVYAGNKYYFARPSRGKQGNALLTILPMPYVLSDGKLTECAIICSSTKQYKISVEHDDVEQDYNFRVDESDIQDAVQGTEIKVNIPYTDPLQYAIGDRWQRFFNNLMNGFSVFNPHCEITTDYFGKVSTYKRKGDIKKMKSESESIHWYSYGAFRDLVYAYIRAGNGNTTVKQFCMERFKGINNSTKNEALLKSMCSKRLEDLREQEEDVTNLYINLKTICHTVLSPSVLGEIGEDQLRAFFPNCHGAKHKKIQDNLRLEDEGYVIPFVLEGLATQETNSYSRLYAGLNNSPLYDDSSLSNLLRDDDDLQVDDEDGIKIALHLICPNVRFTDYSKRRFDLSPFMPAIRKVFHIILSDYYDSRDKAGKERDKSFRQEQKQKEEKEKKEKRDKETKEKEKKLKMQDVFLTTIGLMYNQVTDNGRFEVYVRQAFYKHRPMFAEFGFADINYGYYTKPLVHDWEQRMGRRMFLREVRGVLLLPDRDDYFPIDTKLVNEFVCPEYTIKNAFYIEKRGFADALRIAQIHKRYDIAILSGQGFTTEDIKSILHKVAKTSDDIKVFCFHDCDIYGINICNSAGKEHYIDKTKVTITSMGILPREVWAKNYPIEQYEPPRTKSGRIIQYAYEPLAGIITPDEFNWLTDVVNGKRRRLELNVFSPLEFINYVEEKIKEAGITEKVLPPVEEIEKKIDDIVEKKKEELIKKKIDEYMKDITDLVDRLKSAIIDRDKFEKSLFDEFRDYVEIDAEELREEVKKDLVDNPPKSWRGFMDEHVQEQLDDLPEWDEHVKKIVNTNTNFDTMKLLTSVLEKNSKNSQISESQGEDSA